MVNDATGGCGDTSRGSLQQAAQERKDNRGEEHRDLEKSVPVRFDIISVNTASDTYLRFYDFHLWEITVVFTVHIPS